MSEQGVLDNLEESLVRGLVALGRARVQLAGATSDEERWRILSSLNQAVFVSRNDVARCASEHMPREHQHVYIRDLNGVCLHKCSPDELKGIYDPVGDCYELPSDFIHRKEAIIDTQKFTMRSPSSLVGEEEGLQDLIGELMKALQERAKVSRGVHIVTPKSPPRLHEWHITCPKCHAVFAAQEGDFPSSGAMPHQGGPWAITCPEKRCGHEFFGGPGGSDCRRVER